MHNASGASPRLRQEFRAAQTLTRFHQKLDSAEISATYVIEIIVGVISGGVQGDFNVLPNGRRVQIGQGGKSRQAYPRGAVTPRCHKPASGFSRHLAKVRPVPCLSRIDCGFIGDPFVRRVAKA
jgi:hypothetical protein